MSQLIGFGASLLILLLYFLATLGVVVFVALLLNMLLPVKAGATKDRNISATPGRGAVEKYGLQG